MLFRGNELARDCMNWWNPRTNCNGNFQCRCILYMDVWPFNRRIFSIHPANVTTHFIPSWNQVINVWSSQQNEWPL